MMLELVTQQDKSTKYKHKKDVHEQTHEENQEENYKNSINSIVDLYIEERKK